MCIACHLRSDDGSLGYGKKWLRVGLGIWGCTKREALKNVIKNFLHTGSRGEGYPEPWVMIRTRNYGLQFDLPCRTSRLRDTLFHKPRVVVSKEWDPIPTKSWIWPSIIFTKRILP